MIEHASSDGIIEVHNCGMCTTNSASYALATLTPQPSPHIPFPPTWLVVLTP
jgi:hypothetical protein